MTPAGGSPALGVDAIAGAPARWPVAFGAGEPHRFWNAGDDDLLATAYVEPAHNAEYLLTQLFESAGRNGGTRPDPFDAAFLLTRYRNESAVTEIPRPVQRLLLPLPVAIGKLLGKYGRFADAPEPMRG